MSQIDKESRVVVLVGGLSSERKVSLGSGEQVHQALTDNGYQTHKVDWTADDDLAKLLRLGFHVIRYQTSVRSSFPP